MPVRHDLSRITVPGMYVYLGTSFFHNLSHRPRRIHNHPCYELVCIDTPEKQYFTINPPLYNHWAANAAPETVTSFFFVFTDGAEEDVRTVFRHCKKPVTVADTFGGMEQIRSVCQLVSDTGPGVKTQLAAELHLVLVKLARTLSGTVPENRDVCTLEDKRIAMLEEYFNVRLKDPNCSKVALADELGVSERQLSRILHETYGKNFHEILSESRMTIAEAMFYAGANAAEIASETGYTSVYSFKRAYKAYFGRSFGCGETKRDIEGENQASFVP